MLLKFQIIFTILSALCVALILPIGTFLDWIWALICVFGAFIFFMLMRICKQARETQEENTPTESTPAQYIPPPAPASGAGRENANRRRQKATPVSLIAWGLIRISTAFPGFDKRTGSPVLFGRIL